MRLRKIIGTVSMKDGDGEVHDVEENMRLFSDSILGTKSESSAIVDLDEVKLAILDERSRARWSSTAPLSARHLSINMNLKAAQRQPGTIGTL